ncbi:unnamed protein product [Ambrosiozyma monospora]|uniref:Unnamed protein product n=1 Tax=Ambrosiozyma monospora TaxID=43982 RepID=A0ACB5SZA9_AMBMO|nr:unnamed protein product [Ambrosiozyma monospora]
MVLTRIPIRSSKDITLEDLFTSLIHKRFPLSSGKPLWGLILYDSRTLIFYADHLLGDGTSYLNFQTELLKFMNKPKPVEGLKFTGADSVIFRDSLFAERDISPMQTEIISYKPSPLFLASAAVKTFLPSVYGIYAKYVPKSKYDGLGSEIFPLNDSDPQMRREYHLKLLNVSSEKLSKLLQICRKHQVKLTSLFANICLLALHPITKEHALSVEVPANIRNLIQQEKANELCNSFSDKFGLYMGPISMKLQSLEKNNGTEKLDWDLMKHVQNMITDGFKISNQGIGLLTNINIKEFVENETTKSRDTLEISNLGMAKFNVDSDKDGKSSFTNIIEIVDMIFNQPVGSRGTCFGCNVLATPKGGANFSLTCVKALGPDTVKTYAEGFQYWIDQALALDA